MAGGAYPGRTDVRWGAGTDRSICPLLLLIIAPNF